GAYWDGWSVVLVLGNREVAQLPLSLPTPTSLLFPNLESPHGLDLLSYIGHAKDLLTLQKFWIVGLSTRLSGRNICRTPTVPRLRLPFNYSSTRTVAHFLAVHMPDRG